jgi:hypothetical protein
MQKHIPDTKVANGYMGPWGDTQTFMHFCSCICVAIVTLLVVAWSVSVMYPAKPDSGANDNAAP